jgi:hypothetical protein
MQLSDVAIRLAKEPPFRVLTRALLKRLPVSVRTRALWELSPRPAYLAGLLAAADQARRQGVDQMSAVEFGVASGDGLVALQTEAEAIELETGIRVRVFGFDTGSQGLPSLIGDYRDHPDWWRPGDFPMDEVALRARLTGRTTLVLGNVKDTVPTFFERYRPPPIGFVSVDLDLYSSTKDALQIFSRSDRSMLWHVPVYFDDIEFLVNHKFAGELLAIDEFNRDTDSVKIDRWYGLREGRPFPERGFLDKFYVAHDLEAVSRVNVNREIRHLPLCDEGTRGWRRSA